MTQSTNTVTTGRTSLANFQNPVGLVFRMLLSGKRAAYSALFHECLKIVARPIDAVLAVSERRLFENTDESSFPILLVVGAPRSGTTLVYQTLARYLDVSYFSNLTSFFPRSPISGTQKFGWLAGRSAANFENFYGQTAGLHGPNDGFSIWNRWFGVERYVSRRDLNHVEIEAMRTFFAAWTSSFRKPLLNKNNRNTSSVDLIARALPTSKFIVVRRDSVLVAQSLIKAREQVQGSKKIGWGLYASDSSRDTDPLSYVDEVCDQVTQIELELDRQLKEIPADRIIEFRYEQFCEAPELALQELSKRIEGIVLRESLMEAELKPFKISNAITLSPEEHSRVLARLSGFGAATSRSVGSPHFDRNFVKRATSQEKPQVKSIRQAVDRSSPKSG